MKQFGRIKSMVLLVCTYHSVLIISSDWAERVIWTCCVEVLALKPFDSSVFLLTLQKISHLNHLRLIFLDNFPDFYCCHPSPPPPSHPDLWATLLRSHRYLVQRRSRGLCRHPHGIHPHRFCSSSETAGQFAVARDSSRRLHCSILQQYILLENTTVRFMYSTN